MDSVKENRICIILVTSSAKIHTEPCHAMAVSLNYSGLVCIFTLYVLPCFGINKIVSYDLSSSTMHVNIFLYTELDGLPFSCLDLKKEIKIVALVRD